ncbi:M20/M25/M40 family metallo-hydrolase [Chondromyces crocatus]|uniref:Peptidase M28 domain-containing protein n=1 Tax=Chondromyces crocatus TaxID=52 RepID=A0A0K1EMC4_CHOCO|nr:M20/M25/M40 family metallo-hydrolase [Chondromyces crocatus]AKT42014.1 uncharacterized protein CMC5_062360 [Chondromyces crocatus]
MNLPASLPLALPLLTALLAAACGGGSAPLPEHPGHSTVRERPPVASSSPDPSPSLQPTTVRCGEHVGHLALTPPTITRDAPGPSFENVRAWITHLTQPSLKGRAAGTPESGRVAHLLADALVSLQLVAAAGDGDACQSFPLTGGRDRKGHRDQNVVVSTPVDDAAATRTVIVGAHYDALGVDAAGVIHPGADDNASGVAALLEIARLARPAGVRLVFVAFGAEELGTVGSRHFVANPPVPLEQVELMINLDMVGRPFLDGQSLRWLIGAPANAMGYVVSARGQARVTALIEGAARETKTSLFGLPEAILRGSGFTSDSVPFSDSVPTLFLSTSMHDDYHLPSDTADKIDVHQVTRAIALVVAILNTL